MLEQQVTIINQLGMHARACMKLVKLAERFQSEIILVYNNREVNAKSIMNLMVIGAKKGSKIQLKANGADEAAAIKAVADLINDYFGEGQ